MTEETIFASALELKPTERAIYLATACGDDAAMRKRLEGLLAASDRAGNFMARPAVASPESPDAATAIIDGQSTPQDATITRDGPAPVAEDQEEALGFLMPSNRPDSLGRIGHYEVLQVLGKGGFGIVFRAFDDILQRVVAIKVMAPQLAATSPARKRFLREARNAAAVRHENVVQVYEVAEQPLPYLAMEFIPGETLQQMLNRLGPLDVPECLRIGRQIAEGLAAAHATDLIHRDIKPSNVLIDGGQQRVKITDFGLARAADDASISQSGIIAGTPMYMAPEQAQGQTLDQRADLFSLGSVLYQMVAGRPPFRANGTLAVLKRVAEDTPRPIREIIPETPQWLCDVIAKLHAKNPDERYQSAREVADVLADCEGQLKANSKLKDFSRIPLTKSPAKSSGRNKWAAATAVLLFPVIALAVTEFAGVTHLFRQQATLGQIKPGNEPQANKTVPPANSPEVPQRDTTAVVAGWGEWVDPKSDCTAVPTDKELVIQIPGTRVHDLNARVAFNSNLDAPRVLRPLDGDFTATLRVDPFVPPEPKSALHGGASYFGAGLLIWLDEKCFVRFERAVMAEFNVGKILIQGEWFDNAQVVESERKFAADGPIFLQAERRGDELTLRWSLNGTTWTEMKKAPLKLPRTVRVGPFGVNSTSREFRPSFAEFRTLVEPELTLNTFDRGRAAALQKVAALHFTFDLDTFYQKDGKTFVRDASGNGRDGECHDVGADPTGKSGGGLRNQGKGSVRLTKPLLAHSGAFTITGWIRPKARRAVFAIYDTRRRSDPMSDALFHLSLDQGGHLTAGVRGRNGGQDTIASSRQYDQNPTGWIFVAVRYNSAATTPTLHLTFGEQSIERPSQPLQFPPGVDVTDVIGAGLDGVLDEITVWPRVLADDELHYIRMLGEANSSLSGTTRPLPPTFKNSIGMEFVVVPKGKSWLGGGKDKLGDKEVEIPADFYLGKYEVTQEEWEKVMGDNPSRFSRKGLDQDVVKDFSDSDLKRFPVEHVSWEQCQLFVAKLNKLEKATGWVYRLPKAVEWEYSCRGGPISDKLDSAFDFYFAKPTNTLSPEQANFERGKGLKRTCRVGSYEPNALGLFDMHGNVWEWCDDSEKAADGSSHRLRLGGGWANDSRWSRAAASALDAPTYYANGLGLRLARVPSGPLSPEAKTPMLAELKALREVVVAKEGVRDLAKKSFDAGKSSALELIYAEIDVSEARIQLTQAEGNAPANIAAYKEVVSFRERERELIEKRVKAGIVKQEELLRADSSLGDARARLAKALAFAAVAVAPFTDADVKRIATLSVAEQIEEVRKELKKRNPNFDADLTPTVDNDVVVGLTFSTNEVADISPVRALTGLKSLVCSGTERMGKLVDLSPLQGMQLSSIDCNNTQVVNLAPLRGMPLRAVYVQHTGVTDLTPLAKMPLEHLNCSHTNVANLDVLKGMNLITLYIDETKVDDLTPLKGMPLKILSRRELKWQPTRDGPIVRSLEKLETIDGKTVEEFLKELKEK